MPRFYGKIGFEMTVETNSEDYPGVWSTEVIERNYYGNITRNARRWSSNSDSVNDNLEINNEFSIVADSFALDNLYAMKYIEYLDVRWKISNVTIERPRLVITTGGVYNG